MPNIAYRVSNGKQVHRLEDPYLVWDDISPGNVSLPGAGGAELLDVQTVPGNTNTVFICGEVVEFPTNPSLDFHGIAYSLDKGNTWVQPTGGNYTQLTHGQFINKIWVVNSTTIYAASSQGGKTFKSIDGGQTFNAVLQIPLYGSHYIGTTLTSSQPGVTCLHFIDPVLGIIGLRNAIAFTTDGGNSWTLRTINLSSPGLQTPGVIKGVRISQSGTGTYEIVALGESTIVKSIDNGNTWTTVYNFNLTEGIHLTWIDQYMYAFGTGDLVLRSSNNGTSWVVQQAYNGGLVPTHKGGSFYFTDRGLYSDDGDLHNVHLTLDGGATDTDTWSFVSNTNALWIREEESVSCYLLTPCDSGSPIPAQIVSSTDLANYISNSIRICPGILADVTVCTCFRVGEIPCPPEGTVVPIINDPDYTVFWDCDICLQQCYSLTDCNNPLNVIYTSTDLSTYVGYVIQIADTTLPMSQYCWIVDESTCDVITQPVTVTAAYAAYPGGCSDCSDQCYILTSCDDPNITHVVSNDLSLYVGQIVSHPTYEGGACFIVSIASSCEDAQLIPITFNVFDTCYCCQNLIYVMHDCSGIHADFYTAFDGYSLSELATIHALLDGGSIIQFENSSGCWYGERSSECPTLDIVPSNYTVFDTCDICLPVAPAIPDLPQNFRRIKPGYSTPGCPPEYTEKVSCMFADMMYSKMTVERFGIKMCCKFDEVQWNIKKMILDLKALYDPDLCESAVDLPSCPETDVDFPEATPVSQ